MTKVAEHYQRHRKTHGLSPRSPGDQELSPQTNGEKHTPTNATDAALERAVPFPDAQEESDGTNRKLLYAKDRASSRVVVAWPEGESDDEDDRPTETSPKSQYTTPVSTRSWQSPLTNSESKSRNTSFAKTPVTPEIAREEQSPEPVYKSAVELARSRFEHVNNAEAPLSPTSIASEPVKSSWQRGGSVTKRYAPWEKPADQAPQEPPSKIAWETSSKKQSSNKSDAGSAASSSARSVPWKRSDVTSPSPDSAMRESPLENLKGQEEVAGARSHSPAGVKNVLASWQKPINANMDAESDVWSSISSGVQSAVWKRPDVVPASGTKLPPWQKPKPSGLQETSAVTASNPRPWQEADVNSPPTPKSYTGKLAPWQKPQNDVQDSGIVTSTSWHSPKSAPPPPPQARSTTPSYEIGRQGTWQKPKSPARPKVSAVTPPDVSGRETPVQLWKRREQELKDAAAVKSEPKNIGSRKFGVHLGKPANESENTTPIQQARATPTPAYGRASPIPTVGKVQSPPWVKTTSPAYQAWAPSQIDTQQPAWAKKQAEPSQFDAPSSPKETIHSGIYTPAHDYLRTPVPSDVASAHSGYELTPTFGGAVIETPKSQSVAALRASLGSKPAPPPFLGSPPAMSVKSPGGWLSGTRKAGLRAESPHTREKDNAAPDLPSLAVDQAMSSDPSIPPVDQRSTISGVSSSTPVRSHRMASVESDSEATPVTSHVNHRAIILMAARVTDSPSKSLADMAADSVLITDYSHFQEGAFSDYNEDEDSLVDSGIGTIMPSRSDLPNEFQGIVQKASFEATEQERSTAVDPPSLGRLPTTPEEIDRRENLRARVENFSYDDDDDDEVEEMSPTRTAGRGPTHNDLIQNRAVSASNSERRRTPEVSNEILERIRSVGAATEGSDDGGSSAAVFGHPGTWGAAGGDDLVEEPPPVADRARAISAWNGGSGTGHRKSVDELDTILGRGVVSREGNLYLGEESGKIPPRGDPAPIHSSRGASRILNFYQAESHDEFTGEEESEWASRDPDIDADMMRDESPSPEPDEYDDVVDHILEEFQEEEPSRSPSSRGMMKVQFAPDPNDPFYVGAFPDANDAEEFLDPDAVFGNFWSAEGAGESFDFDVADNSFFTSASQEKDGGGFQDSDSGDGGGGFQEKPFRVVLKPPPSAPSNRGRRQREASKDYDLRYANYLADVDEWKEFSGNAEI